MAGVFELDVHPRARGAFVRPGTKEAGMTTGSGLGRVGSVSVAAERGEGSDEAPRSQSPRLAGLGEALVSGALAAEAWATLQGGGVQGGGAGAQAAGVGPRGSVASAGDVGGAEVWRPLELRGRPGDGEGPRVIVIGGGMAGILAVIRLAEIGLTNTVIYEKGDCLGGTWFYNTYPGLSCDVPAHLYTYSFAPNPDWSTTFAHGPEIHAYFDDVARRYGVDRVARLGSRVESLEYHDGRWHVETADGVHDEAPFVIAATGVLHHPKYPEIEGLECFGGAAFHSAAWDHRVPIAGRRVGVVGTGSSAVQIVSAIVDEVRELTVFQRTPQWILSVPNDPIPEETKETFRRDPAAMLAHREYLRQMFEANFANAVVDAESEAIKVIQQLCEENLERSVRDPVLKAKLRPDYRAACKRLVVSDKFYQAIQRPNAVLVTEGIDHVEPRGVVTKDGVLHELDVLVLATGFHVDWFLRPMHVVGRHGRTLEEAWTPRPSAYLSLSVPDFPNLFMLNGPNGPVGNFSLIDVAELQMHYVLELMRPVLDGKCTEVCATSEALERFEAERVEAAKKTIWVTGCKSWYLDDRGVPSAWPWSFDRFRQRMAAPDFDDYELVA
jgi:cation diffusion facilitator CzcD-associated flavoprotein CzcO